MEKIDILTFSISGGFVGMLFMIKWLRDDLKSSILEIKSEVKDLSNKVGGIDSRLSRVEGMLTNHECCMLQHDHKEKVQ